MCGSVRRRSFFSLILSDYSVKELLYHFLSFLFFFLWLNACEIKQIPKTMFLASLTGAETWLRRLPRFLNYGIL